MVKQNGITSREKFIDFIMINKNWLQHSVKISFPYSYHAACSLVELIGVFGEFSSQDVVGNLFSLFFRLRTLADLPCLRCPSSAFTLQGIQPLVAEHGDLLHTDSWINKPNQASSFFPQIHVFCFSIYRMFENMNRLGIRYCQYQNPSPDCLLP